MMTFTVAGYPRGLQLFKGFLSASGTEEKKGEAEGEEIDFGSLRV